MEKQLIISIGREFGSGGHVIAEALAKRFNIPLYDHNLLDHIAEEKNLNAEELKKFDEKPRNVLLSRTFKGHSSSPSDHIAMMQFDYLKKKAEKGESFVVVGRCAEMVLKEYEAMISLFVLGDKECKTKRVMEVYDISKEEARKKMERHDVYRKQYHNSYCDSKWGDSRSYDLCINSSRLGIDGTVAMLADYIRARRGENK
ncbi:MAG: cytidylate kinase-like family protein [Lachnospiraceae bacterium]|nr:cytidylate kinase-like family protein [Lachnospiraceae bacterium]